MNSRMKQGKVLLFTVAALLFVGCSEDGIISPGRTSSEHGVDASAEVNLAKSGKKKKGFHAVQVITGGAPPQSSRLTGNVRHGRGTIVSGILRGDIVGTVEAIGNGVINEKLAKGTIQLEATYTVTELFGQPVNGGFEGFGVGQVELSPDGPNTGRFNGRGTGDLEGSRIHFTWEFVDGEFLLEGFILMP